MRERAPGKINVCLFLGPTRPSDGRHELVSVMQSLTLADDLALRDADGPSDKVVCPGVEGPNLAARALAAYREATGYDGPPVRIDITKRVPVAAGMGGGSGDAAAALRLIAQHATGAIDEPLLMRLATQLGADVPAQVRPGRALATGAGEHVRLLPDGLPFGVLVLPGTRELSTAAVYAEADRQRLARAPEDLAARLAEVDEALARHRDLPPHLLVNDLQPAALALAPEIADALEQASDAGADVAMVSGSGPTVLGLFLGPHGARRAEAAAHFKLDGRHPTPLTAAPEPGWGER
jgi:4-diphosphocytidyl-2-C-methyl-D-erythritol kinase